MKTRDFLIGFSTGIAAGFLIRETAQRIEPYKPAELVLHGVKQNFKQEDSPGWFNLEIPVNSPLLRDITTDVYRGGISRIREGKMEQYEFYADARTGSVIDLIKQ